jgi:Late embryogenesis abundant protein
MDLPGSKKTKNCRSCKCSKCHWIGIAILVIIIVILAVAIPVTLKACKVRNPTMKINSISVEQPSSGGSFLPTTMVTTTDASVTNPNILALHFKNPNITAYYLNEQVGQAQAPSGVAPARGTVRMKTKFNFNITKLMDNQQFLDEFMKGTIGLNTSVLVGGKVEILGVIPHPVDVEFNCTLTIDVTNFSLKNQTCSQHMWFWTRKPKN